jgi:hypothetical protein
MKAVNSQLVADYIQLSRGDATQPFTGQDTGEFAGSAEPVSCTSDLLTPPVVARLTGHGTRAVTFQGILKSGGPGLKQLCQGFRCRRKR